MRGLPASTAVLRCVDALSVDHQWPTMCLAMKTAMSSSLRRIDSRRARRSCLMARGGSPRRAPLGVWRQIAALNARHMLAGRVASGREVGGHGDLVAQAGAAGGWAGAPQSRGCHRRVVRRQPPLLPGRGQGPGQVRDAACPCGRWHQRAHRRGHPRLLAGRLLPGRRGLRRSGDDRPARRATRPARAAQAQPRDRGLPGRRRPRLSGAALAEAVASQFGVSLHRRTIERARRR